MLFFGDGSLFDLSAIEFAVGRPVAESRAAAPAVALETDSGASVTFGWRAEF